MERVAFLLEETGERLGCMLNPETIVLRRRAGVRPLQSVNGQLTGSSLSDDPLLYTGGGYTELELDLLFDVTLTGSTLQSSDVRLLTAPLWQLAENSNLPHTYGTPPLVRFIWGKSWNILGIVSAVAERFEYFTLNGEPQRSWLRLRFVRVNEPVLRTPAELTPTVDDQVADLLAALPDTTPLTGSTGEFTTTDDITTATHLIIGDGPEGESLPEVAYRYYGEPALWRLLAWVNDVSQPLYLRAGAALQIPPVSFLTRWL